MCVHISSTHRIQSTNEIKHHETDNLVVVGLVSEQLGGHGTDTFLRHDYATRYQHQPSHLILNTKLSIKERSFESHGTANFVA